MRLSKRITNTFCYKLTRKELLMAALECFICLSVTSVLFYNTLLASAVMLPYFHFYFKEKEKKKQVRLIAKANLEFKDGMLAVSSALAAGYSVENAFKAAVRQMSGLYGGDAVIVKEFAEITRRVAMNDNVEDALEGLAKHVGIEDAVYFAEVFRYAKRSGGNLIEIIGKTAANISDKLTVKEEIDVMISGRKMEQRVMNIMPFGIIAYLRLAAYEFIAPMYGNVLGVAVMTACLAGYMGARILSDKIMEIRV